MVRILLAALIATLAASPAAATAERPALVDITQRAPLAVRGSAFVPGERVTVRIDARVSAARKITANARGRFVVKFPRINLNDCESVHVDAIGSRGSRASLAFESVRCDSA